VPTHCSDFLKCRASLGLGPRQSLAYSSGLASFEGAGWRHGLSEFGLVCLSSTFFGLCEGAFIAFCGAGTASTRVALYVTKRAAGFMVVADMLLGHRECICEFIE